MWGARRKMPKPLAEYVYILKEPAKDEREVLKRFIYRKFFAKEKGCLAYFSGMPGNGKSNAALALCEDIDPTFNEERVFFTPGEWLKAVKTIKSGQAIIYDDAGLTANSKTWYSFSNRAISYTSQSMRSREALVVFTVPFIEYIDSQTRKLFNMEFEPLYIDRQKKITYCRGSYILNVAVSPSRGAQKVGKTYYPAIKVVKQYEGNAVEKVNFFRFPLAKCSKEYKKKKDEFLEGFYDDMARDFGMRDLEKAEIKKLENKGEEIRKVLRDDIYRSSLIMAKEFHVPASFIEEQRKFVRYEMKTQKKRKDVLNIHI